MKIFTILTFVTLSFWVRAQSNYLDLEFCSDIEEVEEFNGMTLIEAGYQSFELPHEIFILQKGEQNQLIVVSELVGQQGNYCNKVLWSQELLVGLNQVIYFGIMGDDSENKGKYLIVLGEKVEDGFGISKAIKCWEFFPNGSVQEENAKRLNTGELFEDY